MEQHEERKDLQPSQQHAYHQNELPDGVHGSDVNGRQADRSLGGSGHEERVDGRVAEETQDYGRCYQYDQVHEREYGYYCELIPDNTEIVFSAQPKPNIAVITPAKEEA